MGSSPFLKKEFGVGYQISIEKKPESHPIDEIIENIIMKSVPEASILSNVSSELSYHLPLNSSQSLVTLFADLDEVVEKNHISMNGISFTTLEKGFLLVSRGEIGESKMFKTTSASTRDIVNENENNRPGLQEDANDSKLFVRHVQSLLAKRMLNFKRDKKAWVS